MAGATATARATQKAVLREFTPEQAAAALERSDKVHQRALNTRRSEDLAQALKRGEWVVNGETVIVSEDGTVIDGQHRLWACVLSGVPLKTWVIEGVPAEAFRTIDTGQGRTGMDMAVIAAKRDGMAPMSAVAARSAAGAARLLIQTKAGRFTVRADGVGRRAVQNSEISAYLEANPGLMEDASLFCGWGAWPVAVRIVLWVHYQTKAAFTAAMDEFWRPLHTGANLPQSSPLLLLRTKAGFSGRDRAIDFKSERDVMAQVAKVWNNYATGWHTEMRVLRYSAGVEAFPTLALRPGEVPVNVKNLNRGRRVGSKP